MCISTKQTLHLVQLEKEVYSFKAISVLKYYADFSNSAISASIAALRPNFSRCSGVNDSDGFFSISIISLNFLRRAFNFFSLSTSGSAAFSLTFKFWKTVSSGADGGVAAAVTEAAARELLVDAVGVGAAGFFVSTGFAAGGGFCCFGRFALFVLVEAFGFCS